MATAPAAVTNSNEAEAVDLASVEIPEGVTSVEDLIASLDIHELNEVSKFVTVVKAEKIRQQAEEVKKAFLKVAASMGLSNSEALSSIGGMGGGLRGVKLPVKYQGPNGETWSGRGATPNWLIEQMEQNGKKREDFLIAS